MIGVLVEGFLHWGFSVRVVSESAAAHPYLAPPPSTLIGALAYGLSVVKGFSECLEVDGGLYSSAVKAKELVRWAAFAYAAKGKVFGLPAPHTDMVKVFRLPYQRGARHTWDQKDMWFGACGHGKVYAPLMGFKILYLIDDDRASGELSEHDIVKACYSICRLGSRESLVSVTNVEVSRRIEELTRCPVKTRFYFPRRLVKSYREEQGIVISLPIPSHTMFAVKPQRPVTLADHEDYVVPSSLPHLRAPGETTVYALAEEAAAIAVRFSSGEEVVIAPKEVIS